MNAHDDPLYQQIMAFDLDGEPCALSFQDRLARENGWSVAYAERVIHEYKRFVYLAKTAGHTVTPSVDVDEAWHLHLTYTESYWERMCKEVLKSPLHHGPTKGGESENRKYDDLYRRTLASYEAEFGEAPPADIWPSPEVRFDPRNMPVKVVPNDVWILRKHPLEHGIRKIALVLFCVLFLVGCVMDWGGIGFLILMIGFLFVAAIVFQVFLAIIGRILRFFGIGGGRWGGGGGGGGFFGGCSGDGGGCGGGGCGGGGCGGG